MNTNNRWPKYFYVILLVFILVAGVFVYCESRSRSGNQLSLINSATSTMRQNVSSSTGNMLAPSRTSCSTSTGSDGTMVLPNVSTPLGWKKYKTDEPSGVGSGADFGPIIISTSSNEAPEIEVSIAKYKDSAEESINYSGKYSPFTNTQTWNMINGYFILGLSYSNHVQYGILVRSGSCPDYEYTFDLSYYDPNGAPGVGQGPVNPNDVKLLQAMVKNFAESLPSGI